MKLSHDTAKKIARDAAISLLLYALPVLLMLLTFYLTGQKPWLQHPKHEKTIIKQSQKS